MLDCGMHMGYNDEVHVCNLLVQSIKPTSYIDSSLAYWLVNTGHILLLYM